MKKNSKIIITITAIAIIVILCILLFSKRVNNNHKTPFVVNLELGMTINEVNNIKNTSITTYNSPVYECNLYSIDSFQYYLVDNTSAITLNDYQVNNFYTWDKNYRTENGLSVQSTFGDVLQKYSVSMECWYEEVSYNFVTMEYESIFYLYDRSTCTSYVFSASQLTSQQKNNMLSTGSFYDNNEGRVYLSWMSQSELESISSLRVSWIMRSDCLQQMDRNTPPINSTLPPKEIKGPEKASFYIKFRDNETFTLSDGSSVSANLSSMGLGDLTLYINWSGKTPTKLTWQFDGHNITPSEGTRYAQKNRNSYSISLRISFDVTDWSDYYVKGVHFTIHPITEEERKYEL